MFVSLTTGTHNYVLPSVSDCKGKIFIFYDAEGTSVMTITGGTTDAIMGVDDKTTRDALEEMKNKGAIFVNTNEVVK